MVGFQNDDQYKIFLSGFRLFTSEIRIIKNHKPLGLSKTPAARCVPTLPEFKGKDPTLQRAPLLFLPPQW
jgi:hypothetical protein